MHRLKITSDEFVITHFRLNSIYFRSHKSRTVTNNNFSYIDSKLNQNDPGSILFYSLPVEFNQLPVLKSREI